MSNLRWLYTKRWGIIILEKKMTPLRKLTYFILILLILIFIFLFRSNYIISSVLFLVTIFSAYKWYILLSEELIIYQLMKNSNRMELDGLIDLFGEKAKKMTENLKKKEIVEQNDNLIILKLKDYRFSMTKWRPKQ